MSTTKTIAIGDATFTMKRPSYKTFRSIATKVSALLEVDPEVAFTAPEFEEVLTACVEENLDAWLEEAPYDHVVELWDATIEHCEFQSFFAERRQQLSEKSEEKTLRDVDLMAAQVQRMMKSGLLPETFSLENAMSEAMSSGLSPMNLE